MRRCKVCDESLVNGNTLWQVVRQSLGSGLISIDWALVALQSHEKGKNLTDFSLNTFTRPHTHTRQKDFHMNFATVSHEANEMIIIFGWQHRRRR